MKHKDPYDLSIDREYNTPRKEDSINVIKPFLNEHASAIGAKIQWDMFRPDFLRKFRTESGDEYYDASQDISFVLSQEDNTINILVYAVSTCTLIPSFVKESPVINANVYVRLTSHSRRAHLGRL